MFTLPWTTLTTSDTLKEMNEKRTFLLSGVWLSFFFLIYLFAAGFKEILAGKEYSEILAGLTSHMDTFRNLHNVQKEYLEATKRYKETAAASRSKKSMKETRQKWFDLVSIYTEHTS